MLRDAYGKKVALTIPQSVAAMVIDGNKYALCSPTAAVVINMLMRIRSSPINATAISPGIANNEYRIIFARPIPVELTRQMSSDVNHHDEADDQV